MSDLVVVRVREPFMIRDACGKVRSSGERGLLDRRQADRLAGVDAVELLDPAAIIDLIIQDQADRDDGSAP